MRRRPRRLPAPIGTIRSCRAQAPGFGSWRAPRPMRVSHWRHDSIDALGLELGRWLGGCTPAPLFTVVEVPSHLTQTFRELAVMAP